MIQSVVRFLFCAVLGIVYLIATLWAAGALYFDLPLASIRLLAALCWLCGALILPIFMWRRRRGILIVIFSFIVILAWWLTIKPTNDSDWQPDVAQNAAADIQGDEVTFHNVRNCD